MLNFFTTPENTQPLTPESVSTQTYLMTGLIASALTIIPITALALYKKCTTKADNTSDLDDSDTEYSCSSEEDSTDDFSNDGLEKNEEKDLFQDQKRTDFTGYFTQREAMKQLQEKDGFKHTSEHERNVSQYGESQMWKRFM